MPIDASIYSMLGQGVTPLMNPLDIQSKRAQLQQIALQNERVGLENEARRDQVAQDKDTRAALAETGGDLDKAQQVLMQRGNVKAAKMVADTRISQAESNAKLQEALSKMDVTNRQRISIWNQDIAKRAYNVKQLPPEQRAQAWMKSIEETIEGLQPDPNDPPIIASTKLSMGKGLLKEYQNVQANPQILDTKLDEHLTNAMTTAQILEQMKDQNKPITEPAKLKADFMAGRISASEYESAMKKATTHGAGVNVQLGGVERGVDPNTGELVYFQPQKTGGEARVIPNVRPEPKAAAPKGKSDPAKLKVVIDETMKILDSGIPTGSYAGSGVAMLNRAAGVSTDATRANAKLKTLQASLMMNMPRMEGPQSDKDVQLYREQAAQVGDPTLPVEDRKAALLIIKEMNDRYAAQQEPARTQAPAPQARPAKQNSSVETKVNPANGKTYYKHPDGKFYLEPPK